MGGITKRQYYNNIIIAVLLAACLYGQWLFALSSYNVIYILYCYIHVTYAEIVFYFVFIIVFGLVILYV